MRRPRSIAVLGALWAGTAWAQAAPAPTYETVVHAASSMPDNPVDANEFPASVQVFTREQLVGTQATTLQGALARLAGVGLNDEQGNPSQMDLTLRGLKASPVTGLSQGVGVYVDGVRVNEPDAEEVNFDLVPLEDVERVEIIRGPNTLFGRNNLAGAIQITTRRAEKSPTVEAEASAGSFELERYHVVGGARAGNFDFYGSGLSLTELGFRAQGSSQQARLLFKSGYRDERTDASLSYQLQRDSLQQPGSLPLSLEKVDPSANFTAGDVFNPTLHLVTLNVGRDLGHALRLSANLFGRFVSSTEYNSNFDGPDTLWATRTSQLGAAVQLEHALAAGPLQNHLLLGAEYTHDGVAARLTHEQNPGSLEDCLEGGSAADCPLRQLTTVLSDAEDAPSAYLLERLRFVPNPRRPAQALNLVAGARLDELRHHVQDTSPVNPGQASGEAAFVKVLPTVGATYNFDRRFGVYAAFKEGFRAPAFLELTCANPGAPCVGLEAGVAADPTFTALQPVVAEDYELGVRWNPWRALELRVDAYRTDLLHDIYAVSPTPTAVFFQNVGSTRREGVETSLRVPVGRRLEATLDYAYTRATFQSALDLPTARTGSGFEHVAAGDSLPLVPAHRLNGRIRVALTPWAGVTVSAAYVGPQFADGDEANETPPLPGYVLVGAGADARWQRFTLRVDASNLLGGRYLTYATWAENAAGVVEPFVSPGEPLRITVTLGFVY